MAVEGPASKIDQLLEDEKTEELMEELKTDVRARGASTGPAPSKNSEASLAAAAFGKLASAVAAERLVETEDVQRVVHGAERTLDETEIAARLSDMAAEALKDEREHHGGMVHHGSAAAKLQSAAYKYERILEKQHTR